MLFIIDWCPLVIVNLILLTSSVYLICVSEGLEEQSVHRSDVGGDNVLGDLK